MVRTLAKSGVSGGSLGTQGLYLAGEWSLILLIACDVCSNSMHYCGDKTECSGTEMLNGCWKI